MSSGATRMGFGGRIFQHVYPLKIKCIYCICTPKYEVYVLRVILAPRLFEFHQLGFQVVAVEVLLNEQVGICNARTRSDQCPRLERKRRHVSKSRGTHAMNTYFEEVDIIFIVPHSLSRRLTSSQPSVPPAPPPSTPPPSRSCPSIA